MSGRPPAGATFEVSRVGRGRSRASLGALLVVATFVAFVGFGLAGRSGPDAAAVLPSPSPTVAIADLARLVPAPGDPFFGREAIDPIDLITPAIGPITLTTPRLIVSGRVLVTADHVEIALESPNNRVVARASVDTTDPDGGLRRDRPAEFRVQLDVPRPRPTGTMWVVVTVYSAGGVVLGAERRPFSIAAVAATAGGTHPAALAAVLLSLLNRGGASRLVPV